MENKLEEEKPSDCFPGLSFTCEILFSQAWLSERECFLSLHIPLEETRAGRNPESASEEETITFCSFWLHYLNASRKSGFMVTLGFGCSVGPMAEHNICFLSLSTKCYWQKIKKKKQFMEQNM